MRCGLQPSLRVILRWGADPRSAVQVLLRCARECRHALLRPQRMGVHLSRHIQPRTNPAPGTVALLHIQRSSVEEAPDSAVQREGQPLPPILHPATSGVPSGNALSNWKAGVAIG
jgi:hypothetical protein